MILNNRRVTKFRQDLQEMKVRFEATKKQQESQKLEQSRDSLLRRPNRGTNIVSFLNILMLYCETNSFYEARTSIPTIISRRICIT